MTSADADFVAGGELRASVELWLGRARAALAARPPRLELAAWLAEVERVERRLRCSTPAYRRFDALARRLTVAAIRASSDAPALEVLGRRLRAARYPSGFGRLDRVWDRAELGELIVEATNRGRQLEAGDRQRPAGPRLDPQRIPDDRLDHLIQTHRSLAFVEVLRAERRRRETVSQREASL